MKVGKVSSPLSAVAVAAQEERERVGSPLVSGTNNNNKSEREREEKMGMGTTKERLVEGVKPSTPTLVVVGEGIDEREQGWAGSTQTLKAANVGLAERRRMLAATATGSSGEKERKHSHTHGMGEISVGLMVDSRDVKGAGVGGGGGLGVRGERAMREKELRDLQNRKSERVIVERISVVSN